MRKVLVLLCAFVVGCGANDRHGRRSLAGKVTFRGEPLDQGTIQFLPSDPANGFTAGALISDGKFQVPREQGLPPGVYRVVLASPAPSGGAPIKPAGAPGMSFPPLGKERIPAAYNTATKLT